MNALLALFSRSLRELLRSKAGYVACVTLVGVVFLFLLGARFGDTTAPGLKFFAKAVVVELIFITLAGVSYFASAVTEEKEEGALGLLRMTNLNPLAILLGKSTSRLSAALLLLAATLPFTLLAVTLGGISARQVFATYLTLGSYLVLLANVALLASVLSPRGAIASVITAATVIGTPLLAIALQAAPAWIAKLPSAQHVTFLGSWLAQAGGVLAEVNPFRRIGSVLQTGFSGPVVQGQFWWSLALALFCFVAGWLVFDMATGESARINLPRLVPKPNTRLARYGPQRAWLVSALAWKDFHFIHGGLLVRRSKWLGYGIVAFVVGASGWTGLANLPDVGSSIMWTMAWILALEMCLIGSRILRTELRDKTLIGLAGLPLSMQHVVLMKLDGARRSLGPAFFWMCFGAVMMIGSAIYYGFVTSQFQHFNFIFTGLTFAYFASQVWLLSHLAAHFSLKLKWGALPLSIAIVFLANILGAMFCIGVFVMPIVALTYVAQLRATAYQRLEQLAAED